MSISVTPDTFTLINESHVVPRSVLLFEYTSQSRVVIPVDKKETKL